PALRVETEDVYHGHTAGAGLVDRVGVYQDQVALGEHPLDVVLQVRVAGVQVEDVVLERLPAIGDDGAVLDVVGTDALVRDLEIGSLEELGEDIDGGGLVALLGSETRLLGVNGGQTAGERLGGDGRGEAGHGGDARCGQQSGDGFTA